MAGGYQLFEIAFIFRINQYKNNRVFGPEDESAMNILPNGTT